MDIDNRHKQISHQTTPSNKSIWTEAEELKVLHFLKNHQPIGKPNPEIYYYPLIADHGILKDPQQLHKKVNNMRNNYFKLKMRANSKKAVQEKLNLGLSKYVQDLLLKKCPLYYEMEQAFGTDIPENFNEISTTSAMSNNSDTADESTSGKESPFCEESEPRIKMENDNVSATEYPIDEIMGSCHEVEANVAATVPATAMQALTQTLTHLVEVKRKKYKIDLELKEKELQLQEEMFQFEKEKHFENMRLRAKEIESNENLKLMDLKTKETIALRELEMKERIELAKIEKTYLKREGEFLIE